jgi:hypothetical protein
MIATPKTARQWRELGTFTYRALLDSVSPIRGVSGSLRSINWGNAGRYFEGMSDPYKQFEISYRGEDGKNVTVKKSTAELMLIDKSGYAQAQNTLSQILSNLEQSGIISTTDTLPDQYRKLKSPDKLLTDYPFTDDVYTPDANKKIEGISIPKATQKMFLTPKAFDARVFPTDKLIEVIEAIYVQVAALHHSANCNASLSPSVNIAINRLGNYTQLFANLDNCASDPLVPKSARVPQAELLRGCWADNKFYGDNRSDASMVYSNKNLYLPGLGNPNDSRVPDIYRTGDGQNRRHVNPVFPEYLRPVHFVGLPNAGASANAGFMVNGRSDFRWLMSARQRRSVWTFSNLFETTGYNATQISGERSGFYTNFIDDPKISESFRSSAQDYSGRWLSSFGAVSDPDATIRRLRDYYYQNKSSCEIFVADAMTDFASAIQLARFLSVCPPHVLLHSVMGFHNALLKLSFQQCGIPYSTAIDDYQNKMRVERAGIAAMAAQYNLVGTGDYGSGFGMYVKPPDSVVMADAGLSAATVASLSIAASITATNPAAGLVCFAFVGLAVLFAELEGGRAQNLITPRDRSTEHLRDAVNKGLRCNWFRGYTPEWIVNSMPVIKVK